MSPAMPHCWPSFCSSGKFVGVLGEYLGRVYLETKQRSSYVIRRRRRGKTLMAHNASEDEHWWFTGRRTIAARLIESLALPARATILEIGAGTGTCRCSAVMVASLP